MEVKFQLAKNNEQTAFVNNSFLHSSYNPSKEAERFVDNITLNFSPEYIIIIEPALSYCLPFLKNKFPESKIGAIRISDVFNSYNANFDFVINYYEHSNNFASYFSSILTEEQLLKTFFINWKNSELPYKNQIISITKTISDSLQNAKTLLFTRQYFEKKWFINSINFVKNIKHTVFFNNLITKPILIISSGPSLEKFIQIILDNMNKFFIICLSSAISVCNKYNITPDLYMTTDGGFWAGQHLKKINKEIPLAIPIEAYCNKTLLTSCKILPLDYSDSLLNDYIKKTSLKLKRAERNGTVAGTALKFAIENTNMPIFITGIDLSNQIGFQHTQPNEIEINTSLYDNRIKTKDTRMVTSQFSKGSLEIYCNWFANLRTEHKVFRLIEKEDRNNNLGQIIDINKDEFINQIKNFKEATENPFFIDNTFNFNYEDLKNYISKLTESEKWYNQLYPLDMVSLSHNPDNQELKTKIKIRNEYLINKIRTLLDE